MALDRATQQIDGTLNAGFTELSDHLQNLTDKQARSNQLLRRANNQLTELRFLGRETNRLLAGINQRLELLLEEQRIANVLQENIAQLLRIPDSQKQRQFHLEMGLKFFANASKDADLYHDALKELLAAEALMPGDYFVLHQIGMLYLYAVPLVDLARAAEYLTKAAKYASVESHPDAVRLGNVWPNPSRRSFATSRMRPPTDIAFFAATAYRHAAAACYALGNLAEDCEADPKGRDAGPFVPIPCGSSKPGTWLPLGKNPEATGRPAHIAVRSRHLASGGPRP